MPVTYDNIATTTLGTAASTITFSSIPATYTDLRLVFVGTSATSTNFTVRFNNDSGTNYSWTYLSGTGAAAQAGSFTSQTEFYPNVSVQTTPQMHTVDVFSYAGSTNKTALSEEIADKNGSGRVSRFAILWRNTAAINRIDIIALYGSTNTYAIGTTATLYGIKNA
jgi:hypothetical protein